MDKLKPSAQKAPHDVAIGDLHDLAQLSIEFNMPTEAVAAYYHGQFQDFGSEMLRIPGVSAVFGTGYPFYNTREDGSLVHIPEITRFLGELSSNIGRREASLAKWACTTCQRNNKLPDLKKFCKPCDTDQIKPREIFKAVPDLDFWVVADDVGPYELALIQQRAARQGFFPSDGDIGSSIQHTRQALREVLSRGSSSKKLPVDLHVISTDELSRTTESMLVALSETYIPGYNIQGSFVPISPQSLHVEWEKPDEPYDFTKDFLLSLTLHPDSHESVASMVESARNQVKATLCMNDIVEIVRRYPKENRQLDEPELVKILASRWT